MRFGDEVVLTRGGRGRGPASGPGYERQVRARYLGARGHQVFCALIEDDPNGVVSPFRAGETGWWGRSAIAKPVRGN